MTLKIGLIQMRCEKAAFEENLERFSHYLEEATARDIDIVSFPEISISGYADPTRQHEAILRLDGPEIARLLETTRDHSATVLTGLIEENPGQKPFITQIAVRGGQFLGAYRKRTIEDEEVEWFSPGDTVPVFQHNDLTFGIAICADIGNESVFAECAQQGAQIVFELAAPGLYGDTRNWRSSYEWWEGECQTHLSQYAKNHNIWIAVATQAGRTIDEDFPGGGYVFSPSGKRLYATADWSPGAVFLDIDLGEVREIL